jgi:hypothetical protein
METAQRPLALIGESPMRKFPLVRRGKRSTYRTSAEAVSRYNLTFWSNAHYKPLLGNSPSHSPLYKVFMKDRQ